MATLQISEYENIAQTIGDVVHIPLGPPIATHIVTYSAGTPAASQPFNKATRFIRVATDDTTDANVKLCKGQEFTDAPQASSADDRLPADAVGFWGVNPMLCDRLCVS